MLNKRITKLKLISCRFYLLQQVNISSTNPELGPYCGSLAPWIIYSLENFIILTYTNVYGAHSGGFAFDVSAIRRSVIKYSDSVHALHDHKLQFGPSNISVHGFPPTQVLERSRHHYWHLRIHTHERLLLDFMISDQPVTSYDDISIYEGPSMFY